VPGSRILGKQIAEALKKKSAARFRQNGLAPET
jgi:hypothetical protein